MKNFISKIQHLLSLYYYGYLTEKLPNETYEGKSFDDRLSKSILAHVSGRFLVGLILLWTTGWLASAEDFTVFTWFVLWLLTDIFGALVGSIIIPEKVRTRYVKGCWMPLVGVFVSALFEKYDSSVVR